jgi:hypothetical protein
MQTPAQQAASRSSVDPATWRLHRLWAIERKTIDLECLTHACGALAGAPSLASRPCASPAKKNVLKRTHRGTPRLSRSLGRPAGRTVRRSLYPCASGHTSQSGGLPSMTLKNVRRRHPTENPGRTHRKPARTHPQPTRTHGNPPPRSLAPPLCFSRAPQPGPEGA